MQTRNTQIAAPIAKYVKALFVYLKQAFSSINDKNATVDAAHGAEYELIAVLPCSGPDGEYSLQVVSHDRRTHTIL
jgi:hypothetical protein